MITVEWGTPECIETLKSMGWGVFAWDYSVWKQRYTIDVTSHICEDGVRTVDVDNNVAGVVCNRCGKKWTHFW